MSQSAYIIRPTESDSALVIRPDTQAAVPAATTPEWTQLTTTDQASDAISDPGGFTDTGTGLAAGLFTIVTTTTTTQYDGFAENWPGWWITVQDIYPTFDIATSILEVGMEIVAMPLTAAKHGLVVGVAGTDPTTRASLSQAHGLGLYPNNTTNTNGGVFGSASNGASIMSVSSGVITETRTMFRFIGPTGTNGTHASSWAVGGTAGQVPDLPINSGADGPAITTSAGVRLFFGAIHVSAVAGAVTLQFRVYTRHHTHSGVSFT